MEEWKGDQNDRWNKAYHLTTEVQNYRKFNTISRFWSAIAKSFKVFSHETILSKQDNFI